MDWTPPENPDPNKIIDEVPLEISARNFEVALAKLVWFHYNALRLQPSLYGVRLSFALGYWKELADLHPPALASLKQVRDAAEISIRNRDLSGDALRDAFHDFEAINKKLNESHRTKDLFIWLDTSNPDAGNAQRFYRIAQPALLQAREYRFCGKFIHAQDMFDWSLKRFNEKKHLAEDPKYGINLRAFGEKSFTNEVAILVALLAINDREDEAARVASDALTEFEDADFEKLLEAAMGGSVPEPWP